MDNATTSTVDQALNDMSKRELGNVKVFMVEDDKLIRDLVVNKLTQSGCIPYSTDDGKEAIALAEHYSPDVILLDLMLPGMTGEEILGMLKGNENLKRIPVIVFSNNSEQTDREKVMAMGADRYYVKAYTDLNELVEELKVLTKTAA